MTQIIRYITHPQVLIDPHKDIQRWSLNATGTARIQALARSDALAGTTAVISSAETKAIESATPLANALGCNVQIRPEMHENDRSATGYLPPDEFEQVVDEFFAHPTQSVRGWETSNAAQQRIVAAYQDSLTQHPAGDVLFVGHGAVGTLLYCHLNGLAISRQHDQLPGGGCFFEHQDHSTNPPRGWRLIEDLNS